MFNRFYGKGSERNHKAYKRIPKGEPSINFCCIIVSVEEKEENNKIEDLKKSLYSRKGANRDAHILDLHEHEISVPEKWKEEKNTEMKKPRDPELEKKSHFLRNALIISAVFFFISIGVATYIFLSGGNLISPDKINISTVGPLSVAAGEDMSLDVNITNQNNSPIELADLIATYPQGARNSYDRTTDLPTERIPIGDIAPGETVRKTIKILPFGENGAKLSIGLSLEYRVPNSSNVFNKDTSYDFVVGSSPITLSVDALKETTLNQNMDFTVTMVSNSNEVIKNMILTTDLPFGFSLLQSDPSPITGKFAWKLGDIEPQGKRVIKFSGKIIGGDNQDLTFKFHAGTENPDQTGALDAPLASINQDVAVTKPFIGTQILIGKESGGDYVARAGDGLNMDVAFVNNLSVPVDDLSINVSIDGKVVNEKTISAQSGFYDSNKKIISWDKYGQPDLSEVLPGQSGSVPFHLNILNSNDPALTSLKNPSATISVSITGKRLSESNVPEEITSTAARNIKIASDLRFAGSIVRSIGPIENQGDLPPKVGNNIGYTVLWTVTNNFNDVDNGQVTAILPSYVTWTGVTSPGSEKISYNPDSRQITWNLGKVLAGSLSNSFRQVAFQISFAPSLSQVGSAPALVGASSFSGNDTFTNSVASASVQELNTYLSTDPAFQDGQDRVVQ